MVFCFVLCSNLSSFPVTGSHLLFAVCIFSRQPSNFLPPVSLPSIFQELKHGQPVLYSDPSSPLELAFEWALTLCSMENYTKMWPLVTLLLQLIHHVDRTLEKSQIIPLCCVFQPGPNSGYQLMKDMFVESKMVTSHGWYPWRCWRGCWQLSQDPFHLASLGTIRLLLWWLGFCEGTRWKLFRSPWRSCRIHMQWTHFCCILLAAPELLLACQHSREVSWIPPLDSRLMVTLQKAEEWKTWLWSSIMANPLCKRSCLTYRETIKGSLLSFCCEQTRRPMAPSALTIFLALSCHILDKLNGWLVIWMFVLFPIFRLQEMEGVLCVLAVRLQPQCQQNTQSPRSWPTEAESPMPRTANSPAGWFCSLLAKGLGAKELTWYTLSEEDPRIWVFGNGSCKSDKERPVLESRSTLNPRCLSLVVRSH